MGGACSSEDHSRARTSNASQLPPSPKRKSTASGRAPGGDEVVPLTGPEAKYTADNDIGKSKTSVKASTLPFLHARGQSINASGVESEIFEAEGGAGTFTRAQTQHQQPPATSTDKDDEKDDDDDDPAPSPASKRHRKLDPASLEQLKIASLRSSVLGEVLDSQQLALLASGSLMHKYTKIGERFCVGGRHADTMFLVHRGEVLLELTHPQMDPTNNRKQVERIMKTQILVPIADDREGSDMSKPLDDETLIRHLQVQAEAIAAEQNKNKNKKDDPETNGETARALLTIPGHPSSLHPGALFHPQMQRKLGGASTKVGSAAISLAPGLAQHHVADLAAATNHAVNGTTGLTRAEILAAEAAARIAAEAAQHRDVATKTKTPTPSTSRDSAAGERERAGSGHGHHHARVPSAGGSSPSSRMTDVPHRPSAVTHTKISIAANDTINLPGSTTSANDEAATNTKKDSTQLSLTGIPPCAITVPSLYTAHPHTIFACVKGSNHLFGHGMFFGPGRDPNEWDGASGKFMYSAYNNSLCTHLLQLPRKAFDILFGTYPGIRMKVIRALGGSLEKALKSTAWISHPDAGLIAANGKPSPNDLMPYLLELFHQARVDAGVMLFEEGDICHDGSPLYVLIEGEVELTITNEKGHQNKKVLCSGAVFGELGTLLGFSITASAMTLTSCTFRLCPRRSLLLFGNNLAKSWWPFLRSTMLDATTMKKGSISVTSSNSNVAGRTSVTTNHRPSNSLAPNTTHGTGSISPLPAGSTAAAAKISYHVRDEQLLENSAVTEAFTEFCLKEFNAENIEFWSAAIRFRKVFYPAAFSSSPSAPKPYDLLREAANIYNKYISISGLMQVNLRNDIRKAIKDSLSSGDVSRDLFRAAEREICSLMLQDSFQRFKATNGFAQALEHLAPPPPLPILLNYVNTLPGSNGVRAREYSRTGEGGQVGFIDPSRGRDGTSRAGLPLIILDDQCAATHIPLMFGGRKRSDLSSNGGTMCGTSGAGASPAGGAGGPGLDKISSLAVPTNGLVGGSGTRADATEPVPLPGSIDDSPIAGPAFSPSPSSTSARGGSMSRSTGGTGVGAGGLSSPVSNAKNDALTPTNATITLSEDSVAPVHADEVAVTKPSTESDAVVTVGHDDEEDATHTVAVQEVHIPGQAPHDASKQ